MVESNNNYYANIMESVTYRGNEMPKTPETIRLLSSTMEAIDHLLAKLVESSLELDPVVVAHLRKNLRQLLQIAGFRDAEDLADFYKSLMNSPDSSWNSLLDISPLEKLIVELNSKGKTLDDLFTDILVN